MPAHPAPLPPLLPLADRCVQCGLCLPACPTYRLDRLEAESPRGRIALASALERGRVAPTPAGERHLDQCLGCRQCEAVCPAGVEYGALLLAARSRQRLRRAPPWRQRALEWLVARPRWLAALLQAYRLLFPLLPPALRRLPRPPPSRRLGKAPATGAIALFVGCLGDRYDAAARAALLRLLDAAGCPAAIPDGQGCCGALHAHGGDLASAAALAARNRDAFADATQVLTLASGCHAQVAAALPGVQTRDALAFLAGKADALAFRPCHAHVALHLPCTQRSVTRSDAATRALLARVPGLRVTVLDAGHGCCGAAGSHMLLDPARAAAFRAPLLAQATEVGATHLLSANVGCRLHLANATGLPVQHPLEFLGECLA